jgi:hypothetical protein
MTETTNRRQKNVYMMCKREHTTRGSGARAGASTEAAKQRQLMALLVTDGVRGSVLGRDRKRTY